ncbi:MAG TPA: hypothetical protein VFU47_11090 [Armatimonadota bacterium]|jgi:hypothetical protein|nr:hypothetical protein [Armatimonadota bacterium]
MSIVLYTDRYMVRALPRGARERASSSRLYVADEVASAADERLRELQKEESELGDRRFSTRGDFPDVDKLYDRLNRRIATVKREVALDAVRRLPRCGDVTARFSRYAGCSCPCSPGVVLSRPVYLEVGGVTRQVDFWVETLPRVEIKSA